MYNRKTTAEDLWIIWIVTWGFSLVLLLIGLIYYPIVWIWLMLFTCSLVLIIAAILLRNRMY